MKLNPDRQQDNFISNNNNVNNVLAMFQQCLNNVQQCLNSSDNATTLSQMLLTML
jgi:hypothetical protein